MTKTHASTATLNGLLTPSGTELLAVSIRVDAGGRTVVRAENGPRVYEWNRDALGDADVVSVPGGMWVSGLRAALAAAEVQP